MNYTPYFILLLVLAIALYFIFRKRNLTTVVLSTSDKKLLLANVAYYEQLSGQDKVKFEQKVSLFLGEVKIEGVGLTINALDRLLIASSAVIPIFGFDNWRYKNLSSVVLYPDTFDHDFQFEGGERKIMGMVGTGYMNGQMVLSQAALQHGFSKSAGKENTGIHEFVHLLDKADGATDGIPKQLLPHEYAMPWLKMMHEEMTRINTNQSDINPYALTNEAEFFAVVAEYFFEKPEILKEKHPGLYQQLCVIFAQDLA